MSSVYDLSLKAGFFTGSDNKKALGCEKKADKQSKVHVRRIKESRVVLNVAGF